MGGNRPDEASFHGAHCVAGLVFGVAEAKSMQFAASFGTSWGGGEDAWGPPQSTPSAQAQAPGCKPSTSQAPPSADTGAPLASTGNVSFSDDSLMTRGSLVR